MPGWYDSSGNRIGLGHMVENYDPESFEVAYTRIYSIFVGTGSIYLPDGTLDSAPVVVYIDGFRAIIDLPVFVPAIMKESSNFKYGGLPFRTYVESIDEYVYVNVKTQKWVHISGNTIKCQNYMSAEPAHVGWAGDYMYFGTPIYIEPMSSDVYSALLDVYENDESFNP